MKEDVRNRLCDLIEVGTRQEQYKLKIGISAHYPYRLSDVLRIHVVDLGTNNIIATDIISVSPLKNKNYSRGIGSVILDIRKLAGDIQVRVTSQLVNKTCVYTIRKPEIPIKKPPKKKPTVELGTLAVTVLNALGNPLSSNIEIIGENYHKILSNVSSAIVKLPPGEYTVKAWREGYKTSVTQTIVKSGRITKVRLLLAKVPKEEKPKPVKAKITIRPFYVIRERTAILSTAKVYVDGRYVGNGMVSVEVLAGTHTIRVEHPDYETAVKQVTVKPGEHKTVDIIMKRKPKAPPSKAPPTKAPPTAKPQLATIKIYNVISSGTRVVPIKANVYIDGRHVGTGDMLTIRVAPGRYTIVSETPEYRGERTIEVESGETKTVYIVLHPKPKKAKPPTGGGGGYPMPPGRPRPLPM